MIFQLLFLSLFSYGAKFEFPSNLDVSQAKEIVQSFSVGFIARSPFPLDSHSEHTQVSLGWNQISTGQLSRLGSTTQNHPVTVQEIHFSKLLPYDVELGLQSNLLVVDNDLSTFGSYARWTFLKQPFWSLAVFGHGASANFKGSMGTNLYGGALSLDLRFSQIQLSMGTGQLRSTTTFQPQVFSTGAGSTSVRIAKIFPHQFVKISYRIGKWTVTGQSDWIDEFFSAFTLGYLF